MESFASCCGRICSAGRKIRLGRAFAGQTFGDTHDLAMLACPCTQELAGAGGDTGERLDEFLLDVSNIDRNR